MRLPYTVPHNTYWVYQPSEQTENLQGEVNRTLRSEDVTWDEKIPSTLVNLCVRCLVFNFQGDLLCGLPLCQQAFHCTCGFRIAWEFEIYYYNFLTVHWRSQSMCWLPLYEPDLCCLLRRSKYICKIWGFHSHDYEYNHVLGCDVRNVIALCKNLLSLYFTVKMGCGMFLPEVCQSLPRYMMSSEKTIIF